MIFCEHYKDRGTTGINNTNYRCSLGLCVDCHECVLELTRIRERQWVGQWLKTLIVGDGVVYGIWIENIESLERGNRPAEFLSANVSGK